MLRMPTNSLYLSRSKSMESNTSIYPCFGMIINAIQWFLQKYHDSQIFEGSAYYTKSLRLHLLKVVWCPYDIPALPPLKLKRYVRTNYPNNFSVGRFSHFIYFLAWLIVFDIPLSFLGTFVIPTYNSGVALIVLVHLRCYSFSFLLLRHRIFPWRGKWRWMRH